MANQYPEYSERSRNLRVAAILFGFGLTVAVFIGGFALIFFTANKFANAVGAGQADVIPENDLQAWHTWAFRNLGPSYKSTVSTYYADTLKHADKTAKVQAVGSAAISELSPDLIRIDATFKEEYKTDNGSESFTVEMREYQSHQTGTLVALYCLQPDSRCQTLRDKWLSVEGKIAGRKSFAELDKSVLKELDCGPLSTSEYLITTACGIGHGYVLSLLFATPSGNRANFAGWKQWKNDNRLRLVIDKAISSRDPAASRSTGSSNGSGRCDAE